MHIIGVFHPTALSKTPNPEKSRIPNLAGPGGGTAEKPVGLVYVGIADSGQAVHFRRVLPGDREAVRERAVFFALAALRRFLLPPAP